MAKKRTVRPFYTKPMQRMEQLVRSQPINSHALEALSVIEEARLESYDQHRIRRYNKRRVQLRHAAKAQNVPVYLIAERQNYHVW
jgi:hypothetical protein